MAYHPLWSNEYWLLLLQLYMKKPIGIKPVYFHGLVSLALEIHIDPAFLHEQMFYLRQSERPSIKKLWDEYGKHPKKLEQKTALIRKEYGFSFPDKFFKNVEIKETWEKDFRPINNKTDITPATLIMILNLYFQLTPVTMVSETPEIEDLSHLISISTDKIIQIMHIFQYCDPYLNRHILTKIDSPLLEPCQDIWNRFGNKDPRALYTLSLELKNYFTSM